MAKAKGGLGKGLGALISENPEAAQELNASTGGLHNYEIKTAKNVPPEIEVDDDGGLWINPKLLKPNPRQMRKEFNKKALDELSASIKEKGILEPIVIEKADSGEFYIIAGERRTRAALQAEVEKVPVRLGKFDDQQKLEMALIENIQREDLNPIEEATAYYNLIQMSDLSQEEVAKRVGKNRATVANAIRLLKLPEDIQHALITGQITAGHARALLMVKNDADMRVMFGKIVGSQLSVREAEALAENYNNGGRAGANKKTKKAIKKDPDVEVFEQELRNIFGVKGINLKGNSEKGAIEIAYTSQKDFDRICNLLKGIHG